LLETDPRLRIAGECDSTVAAVLLRDSEVDILLLGLETARPGSAATLQALPPAGSAVRTIILTDCIDRPDVARALELGACGVIPRDSPPEVLFSSIHSVMAGDLWIERDRASEAAPSLRKLEIARRRSLAFGLTRRELEIVRAVIAGCTNKEIAERSAISENTVKSHLAHIFNKLGASNRVELALFASHHRLLDGI
jgi:DNA-binding NarL/FixJ family response regulator